MFRITDGIRVKNLNLPPITKLGFRSLVFLIRSGEWVHNGIFDTDDDDEHELQFSFHEDIFNKGAGGILKTADASSIRVFQHPSKQHYTFFLLEIISEEIPLMAYWYVPGSNDSSAFDTARLADWIKDIYDIFCMYDFVACPAPCPACIPFQMKNTPPRSQEWRCLLLPVLDLLGFSPIVSHFSFSFTIILIFCHVVIGSTCFCLNHMCVSESCCVFLTHIFAASIYKFHCVFTILRHENNKFAIWNFTTMSEVAAGMNAFSL